MIKNTTVLTKSSDARYRNIGGEGVVVRQSAGEVLVVNGVGARVLDLLEARASVGGLLDTLAAEYAIDQATLERDVLAYLQELLDAGIIEDASGGSPD